MNEPLKCSACSRPAAECIANPCVFRDLLAKGETGPIFVSESDGWLNDGLTVTHTLDPGELRFLTDHEGYTLKSVSVLRLRNELDKWLRENAKW